MKQSKGLSSGWLMPVVLLLGLLTVYVLFLYLIGKKTTAKQVREAQESNPNDENADIKKVVKLISEEWPDGIHPLYLTAIAMHETGEFTSPVFLANNNLFGMRHPKERETTSIGDINGDGYANYKSLQDSVKDFRLWIDAHGLPYVWKDVSTLIQAMKELKYMEASYLKYNAAVVKHLIRLTEIFNYA